MAVNRLFTKEKSRRPRKLTPAGCPKNGHEAVEVSLCDEGMCFCCNIRHEVGTVLLVDFEPEATDNDQSLRTEAVVVDCQQSACGTRYDITVIFTGN